MHTWWVLYMDYVHTWWVCGLWTHLVNMWIMYTPGEYVDYVHTWWVCGLCSHLVNMWILNTFSEFLDFLNKCRFCTVLYLSGKRCKNLSRLKSVYSQYCMYCTICTVCIFYTVHNGVSAWSMNMNTRHRSSCVCDWSTYVHMYGYVWYEHTVCMYIYMFVLLLYLYKWTRTCMVYTSPVLSSADRVRLHGSCPLYSTCMFIVYCTCVIFRWSCTTPRVLSTIQYMHVYGILYLCYLPLIVYDSPGLVHYTVHACLQYTVQVNSYMYG